MVSTIAAADNVLKIGYGKIHEQLDNFTVALKLMSKGSKHITGGNVEAQFAVHTGRTWGIGARNEYENLPAAGANTDARATVGLRYQYGTIEGSGQVFAQVQTDPQAFVDWMQREVEGIRQTMERDLNRQLYGDSTGTLALLTAGATTATVLNVDQTLWFERGQRLDVLTAETLGSPTPTSGLATGDVLTVASVDHDAGTITVTGGTVTAAVGSAVVLASYENGSRTTNWKKEWEGFGSIISETAPLHGINPATEPVWAAGYVESSVGTLTELDLTHFAQAIYSQGTKLTDFITGFGVANAYWQVLQGLRRYDGAERLKGGAQTPVFQSVLGDIPFTIDPAAPAGALYGVNRDEWFMNQVNDWQWLDKDGSKWHQVPFKDAWRATISKYANVGVYRRNAFGKLTGITVA